MNTNRITISAARSEADIKLSKRMSRILRHRAPQLGISMRSDGYVYLEEMLRHSSFHGVLMDDIIRIVANCEKQRFQLGEDGGRSMIRAAQGHTIKGLIRDEELLTRIENPADVPFCVHGTMQRFLPSIMANGLNKMGRNHIHFAAGMPGANGVISGMRKSSEVAIVIDVAAAMEVGIQFYRSSNNVILSAGLNGDGTIPAAYFAEVIHLRSNLHSGSITSSGGRQPDRSGMQHRSNKRSRWDQPVHPGTAALNLTTEIVERVCADVAAAGAQGRSSTGSDLH